MAGSCVAPLPISAAEADSLAGVTDGEIATAIRAQRGNLTTLAVSLNTRRGHLQSRINSSSLLRSELQEQHDAVIDHAEANIYNAVVDEQDLDASKFVLRTVGRDRGYSTSTELRGDPNSPIQVEESIIVFRGVAASPRPEEAHDGSGATHSAARVLAAVLGTSPARDEATERDI